MPFNTTTVPNGVHHLVVSVVDPAGNAAPVLDRQINVENPEHGAHSVKELVGVTAMSDQTARNNLKGLLARETVVKTERAGKTAYALPSSN